MATNRRIVKIEGPDFYPTPPWGTRVLVDHVKLEGTILEPACGNGAMSKVLIDKTNCNVISSELYNRGYGVPNVDFLNTDLYTPEQFDNVVTNPPFNIAEQFLARSLEVSRGKVCMLLRLAFLESKRRYNSIFHNTPPSTVLVFSERLSMYPENYEVKGGGTTSYAWFVWDKSAPLDHDTTIEWAAPGYKNSDRRKTDK